MKNIKFFDMDHDKRKTITLDLLKFIPESWIFSCGVLRAPWKLTSSREACLTAGYFIEDDSAKIVNYKDPDITGKDEDITPEDLCSIVEHRKLPRSIGFSTFDHPKVPPQTIKNIAPYYIKQGYTGALYFYQSLDKEEQSPAGIFIVSRSNWYGRLSSLGVLPRKKSVTATEIAETNGEFPSTYSSVVKICWDDLSGGRA